MPGVKTCLRIPYGGDYNPSKGYILALWLNLMGEECGARLDYNLMAIIVLLKGIKGRPRLFSMAKIYFEL